MFGMITRMYLHKSLTSSDAQVRQKAQNKLNVVALCETIAYGTIALLIVVHLKYNINTGFKDTKITTALLIGATGSLTVYPVTEGLIAGYRLWKDRRASKPSPPPNPLENEVVKRIIQQNSQEIQKLQQQLAEAQNLPLETLIQNPHMQAFLAQKENESQAQLHQHQQQLDILTTQSTAQTEQLQTQACKIQELQAELTQAIAQNEHVLQKQKQQLMELTTQCAEQTAALETAKQSQLALKIHAEHRINDLTMTLRVANETASAEKSRQEQIIAEQATRIMGLQKQPDGGPPEQDSLTASSFSSKERVLSVQTTGVTAQAPMPASQEATAGPAMGPEFYRETVVCFYKDLLPFLERGATLMIAPNLSKKCEAQVLMDGSWIARKVNDPADNREQYYFPRYLDTYMCWLDLKTMQPALTETERNYVQRAQQQFFGQGQLNVECFHILPIGQTTNLYHSGYIFHSPFTNLKEMYQELIQEESLLIVERGVCISKEVLSLLTRRNDLIMTHRTNGAHKYHEELFTISQQIASILEQLSKEIHTRLTTDALKSPVDRYQTVIQQYAQLMKEDTNPSEANILFDARKNNILNFFLQIQHEHPMQQPELEAIAHTVMSKQEASTTVSLLLAAGSARRKKYNS